MQDDAIFLYTYIGWSGWTTSCRYARLPTCTVAVPCHTGWRISASPCRDQPGRRRSSDVVLAAYRRRYFRTVSDARTLFAAPSP